MTDKDSSNDNDNEAKIESEGEDNVAIIVTPADDSQDSASADAEASEPEPESEQKEPVKQTPRRSWMGLLNFLLIIGLAAAAGYYWWLQQQAERDYENTIASLKQEIESKVNSANIESSLTPLKVEISETGEKLGRLERQQQELQLSSEKLYELYGRDKNDWQLAEVEYLMRVAQHKLILENDFAGAAITLQAASDKIALTGDPGLLPVRVQISEEIAVLKTRKRPDLVGMTLVLAQLGRQVRVLKPGFAPRISDPPAQPAATGDNPQPWMERLTTFIDSLVEIRHETSQPSEIEANIADVGQTLEDNLKLARWAVLERDTSQYRQLIQESLRLFREFYNIDDAANDEFLSQLQALQKAVIKPDKPDIGGSLQLLQLTLSKRENAPVEETPDEDASVDAGIAND